MKETSNTLRQPRNGRTHTTARRITWRAIDHGEPKTLLRMFPRCWSVRVAAHTSLELLASRPRKKRAVNSLS